MANQHNQHYSTEPLPPEFESLQHRLVEDGALWRAGLPSTERLEQRLDTLARQERAAPLSPTENARRRGRLWLMTSPKEEPPMFHRRIKTVTAVVAIAAVVALLAVLFYSFANGHGSRTGSPSATRQSTPIPPTPSGNGQQQQDNTWATPAIAPSNPQVVYQLAQPSASAKLTLKRSADGGKTWKTFAVPAGSSSDNFAPNIVVSPLNAQYVYLTVGGTRSGSDCAVTHALKSESSLSGGQNICDIQYISKDGGAHWDVLNLPLSGSLGDTTILTWPSGLTSNSLTVFRVQSNRLYSALGPYTENGAVLGTATARLVTSSDGGLTWQLVDTGLVSDSMDLCDYAPAPVGSTVFAITASGCNNEAPQPMLLWRSDDAGAHWTQVGTLPANVDLGMIVVRRGDAQEPLLYIDMAQATTTISPYIAHATSPEAGGGGFTPSPTNLQVSADGGKTWQSAPTQGFPNAQANPGAPLGVLSDGSVLFVVPAAAAQTGADTFYTWKMGNASWHKVGPDLQVVRYAYVTAPDAAGKQTLCVVSDYNFNFEVHFSQL